MKAPVQCIACGRSLEGVTAHPSRPLTTDSVVNWRCPKCYAELEATKHELARRLGRLLGIESKGEN